MRLPGVHVLLAAGVVASTSIGTVSAFALSGAVTSVPVPAPAPPPAIGAPAVPPPPPAPAAPPVVAPAPVGTGEPAPRTTRSSPRTEDGGDPDARPERRDRASEQSSERQERRERREQRRSERARPDGRFDDQVEYACREGYLDEEYCEPGPR